jgi:hypothetical protein
MASTYSSLKIQLMATGENSGTWGNVTNDNLGVALEEAIVGSADVTFASGTVTLTLTNTNATQTARNLRLNLIGTSGGAQNLIVPAIEKVYIVNNGCADAITVKNSTGTGIAVPAGKTMYVYNDGTNVVDAITHLTSLTLATSLPPGSGGTGVNSVGTAGNVLTSNGTAWVSQAAAASNNASALTTGVTAVNVGGTGATTLNAEAVVIGNTTGAVKFVAPGTTGNVLTSNGTVWLSQAVAAAGGGLSGLQIFNSPGTFTPPPSTTSVYLVVGGAGGGGGGPQFNNANGQTLSGGTGGAGGTGIGVYPVTGGSPVTITVGTGGNAGSPSASNNPGGSGNAGNLSSFGNLLIGNGGNGGGGGNQASPGPGGTAGNAPLGTASLQGGAIVAPLFYSNTATLGGPGGTVGSAGRIIVLF